MIFFFRHKNCKGHLWPWMCMLQALDISQLDWAVLTLQCCLTPYAVDQKTICFPSESKWRQLFSTALQTGLLIKVKNFEHYPQWQYITHVFLNAVPRISTEKNKQKTNTGVRAEESRRQHIIIKLLGPKLHHIPAYMGGAVSRNRPVTQPTDSVHHDSTVQRLVQFDFWTCQNLYLFKEIKAQLAPPGLWTGTLSVKGRCLIPVHNWHPAFTPV